MPYNIWCGGCGNHVGMGVRYNAEKKKVGKYYTTPIYQFKMKCHLCDNYIVMETDPKNFDYTIISGAQRKNQKWDMAENEQVLTEDREAVKKLSRDAMYKLEHGVDDTKKLKKAAPSLTKIAEIQSAKKDDYDQNQALRKKFRTEKKELSAVEASDNALLSKSSLEIELVPETEEDKKLASLLKYSVPESYEEKREQKRESIQSRNIFAPSTVSSPNSIEISPRSSSSSSSSSTSSSSKRSSGAQQTLINKVMKKASVFGSLGSKSSSSSGLKASAKEWLGRTTKSLIGGTAGIILKRKRKSSEDNASVIHEVSKRSKLSDETETREGGKLTLKGGATEEQSDHSVNIDKDARLQELDVGDTEDIQGLQDDPMDPTKAERVLPSGMSFSPKAHQIEEGRCCSESLSRSTLSSSSFSNSSDKTPGKSTACGRKVSSGIGDTSLPSHTHCAQSRRESPNSSTDVNSNSEAQSQSHIRTFEHEEIDAAPKGSTCEHDSSSLSVEGDGEISRTESLQKSSLSLVSCYSSSSGSEDEL
ncbi:probable splicing factor YJU2B [Lytechinus pictus]|uniref:probable splicing factor YJU2B n=1 Tax=Lytechinus pictus TaxID=7653 RepID=UPI0030B9EC38